MLVVEILEFIKIKDCYQIFSIAYQILLTIHTCDDNICEDQFFKIEIIENLLELRS